MSKKTLFLLSAGTLLYMVSHLAGCTGIDTYNIDAPEDLKQRIDSIAAAKASQSTGDTTYITITTAIAGAEDCSTGWDAATSQWFTIPSNKLLHIDFVNHGSGANNWNNWNLRLASAPGADADGYEELFVIRSDAYGWGNADYNSAMLHQDYNDAAVKKGFDDMWAYFRSVMEGARVEMEIDHSKTGNVYVTVKQYVNDGSLLVETYEQPVSATADVYATLVCDGSWFEVNNAYTVTSKVQTIDDEPAQAVSVTGYPAALEIGQTDFWGSATATVTFADGSTIIADTADLTFQVVPDLTTVGEKTVIYSYSKTKLGNYGTPVVGYYKLNIVNPVTALAITKQPTVTTYYAYNQSKVAFCSTGLEVTATYADNTTGILDNSMLLIDSVNTASAGPAAVTIAYRGVTATVSTTCNVNVVQGTAGIGSADYTNVWWTTFSDNCVLASGHTKVFKMMLYSDNLANYHSPCVILRKTTDASQEYAVVRMDHYGWGGSYEAADKQSNWNWDTFLPNLCYSTVTITIKNNGNDTADILYDVTFPNGDKHFQNYTGIVVDKSDLQAALVTEESYLVIYE